MNDESFKAKDLAHAHQSLPIDHYVGHKYPEVLKTMAVELYVSLSGDAAVRQVLSDDERAALAFRATEAVRRAHGGFSHYFGKGLAYELSVRDREIYRRFSGDNYDALAREYDLTEMRIRQIINACREEDRRLRQQDLF